MRRWQMKKFLAIFLLVVPSLTHADPWTKTDTAYQAATVTLMSADWMQTSWMMRQNAVKDATRWRNPNGTEYKRDWKPEYAEINPLLGDHPGQGKINAYFLGIIVGHTAIARLLPNPYRRIWQGIYIVTEAGFVAHNFSVGARIEF
jgi:hypothetical protein